MTRALRREVAGMLEDARGMKPEPLPPERDPFPWRAIDEDPHLRALYIRVDMPPRLLDAVWALEDQPDLHAEADAEAERREPVMAAGVRDLKAALDAAADEGPLVIPRPAEAIQRGRRHLHGPQNQVDLPCGSRMNRRYVGDGVHYTLDTLEGAVEVVLDHWAHLCFNMDRSGSNFWGQSTQEALDHWVTSWERRLEERAAGGDPAAVADLEEYRALLAEDEP
jgi:hypothetical protein